MITKYKNNYNYMHRGVAYIRIKLINIKEMGTIILACLRDYRYFNFSDSLLEQLNLVYSMGSIIFFIYIFRRLEFIRYFNIKGESILLQYICRIQCKLM